MIKQTEENDIPTVEKILLNAVNWMKRMNCKIYGMRTV